MNTTPRVRRFALTAHIIFTIGWLGGIVGFLALAIAGLVSKDVKLVRASYLAMELIGWYVLVPLSVASLMSGLIMSLGTTWGLFRHYWVLVKFVITIVSLFILLMYTQTLDQLGDLARNETLSVDQLRNASPVLHASAAILALLVNTVLSVYKPHGSTAFGRRMQTKPRRAVGGTVSSEIYDGTAVGGTGAVATSAPRWLFIVGIHAIGLALLFVLRHLMGGGFPGH